MKIILIGTAYPMRGGMAQYLASLYSTISAHEHEVRIISFKRQYPSFLFPGTSQMDESEIAQRPPAKAIIDSIGPASWIRAYREIRSQGPDLVIFNYWMPFFLFSYASIALLVRRFTSAKILFICHNVVPHEPRPGDVLLTRIGFRIPHGFLVHSEEVQADLLRFRPDADVSCVPLPSFEFPRLPDQASSLRRKMNIPDTAPVILFFGYIRRYKGLHVLLEALKRSRGAIHPTLIIAGEFYEDEAVYQEQIRRSGLGNRVRLVNRYIPNEEVWEFFETADVVVLPYLSATQSGIVQIAYGFNKPVIVTDVGGLPQMVDHRRTGLVVPPNDPDSLADAVNTFFTELSSSNITNNIESFKTRFSWDRVVDAIERFA